MTNLDGERVKRSWWVFRWSLFGAAGSAAIGMLFILQRSAFDSRTFTYACIVSWGSSLLGAAAALIAFMSPWPMTRARRRITTVLLTGTELLLVPLLADEVPSFARNLWLMLSLLPAAAYGAALARISGLTRSSSAILGSTTSGTISAADLGVVKQVISCYAWIGVGRTAAIAQGGATPVEVVIAEQGIEVRLPQSKLRRIVYAGRADLSVIRLRWQDIRTVEVTGGRAVHNYTLKFTFPGGRGFTLQKGFLIDNLEPLVQALEAHGTRVVGRVILPVIPYGSRPTRRLAIAAILTGLLAAFSASPSWLVLAFAPPDVKTDPGMIVVYAITAAVLIVNLDAVCQIVIAEFARLSAHARKTSALIAAMCVAIMSVPYALMWLVLLVWWGARPLGAQIATLSGLALLIAPVSTIATLVLVVNIHIRLSERARAEGWHGQEGVGARLAS